VVVHHPRVLSWYIELGMDVRSEALKLRVQSAHRLWSDHRVLPSREEVDRLGVHMGGCVDLAAGGLATEVGGALAQPRGIPARGIIPRPAKARAAGWRWRVRMRCRCGCG
jgi:hypothetical protein